MRLCLLVGELLLSLKPSDNHVEPVEKSQCRYASTDTTSFFSPLVLLVDRYEDGSYPEVRRELKWSCQTVILEIVYPLWLTRIIATRGIQGSIQTQLTKTVSL